MIRKHLIKTLRVVRTKIGAWHQIDLVWQDATNPPRPADVVPFDLNLALAAGTDRGTFTAGRIARRALMGPP